MATNNPKLKLFEDDPLTKVLKKEHWDLVDPFTFQIDEGPVGTTPKDKFTFEVTIGDGNEDEPEDPGLTKLKAPNLEDITVVKSEIYFDQKNTPRARFIFNVKNSVGDDVIGVYGKGG
jgi:hypothetical protein